MVVNPVGAVNIYDGAVPRIITATVGIGTTGGQLMFFSGANNLLSSGLDSYSTGSIRVAGAASGALFNGLVITPGLSASGTNNYVALAQNGTYVVTSAGTILAGEKVMANGGDAVVSVGNTAASGGWAIGRALSPAGSEGYVIVNLFG